MISQIQRLQHLTKVHRDMSKLLEARINRISRELSELEEKKANTIQSVERISTSGLTFYGSATRRLVELELAKVRCEKNLQELRRKRLNIESRHDILLRRAMALSAANQRRQEEEQGQEIALQMKATGKHNMPK